MNDENPYQSPQTEAEPVDPSTGLPIQAPVVPVSTPRDTTALLTAGTIFPRYFAGTLDNLFAIALCIILAKLVPDEMPFVQFPVCIGAYLGYFLFCEALFSRTPGKLLTGLIVVSVHGERCTFYQATIRTLFRILEANPLLVGGLPAGLCIFFSGNHQRFGDRFARTIVVPPNRLQRFKRPPAV